MKVTLAPPCLNGLRRSSRIANKASTAGCSSTSLSITATKSHDKSDNPPNTNRTNKKRKKSLIVNNNISQSQEYETKTTDYDVSQTTQTSSSSPATTTTTTTSSSSSSPKKTRKRIRSTSTKTNTKETNNEEVVKTYLPRTREMKLIHEYLSNDPSSSSSSSASSIPQNTSQNILVMGIDEAGRGPLAGPVVAAAAIVPTNIEGIIDSKKITKEDERERLFETIVHSPNVQWAASIIDAKRIDEINILQATLEGMSNAALAVMGNESFEENDQNESHCGCYPKKSLVDFMSSITESKGCYTVSSTSLPMDDPSSSFSKNNRDNSLESKETNKSSDHILYYALVDGNRLPTSMPCDAEPMVKGDSREYAIAAASIIAKVIRDRIMNQYHKLYPQYNLIQHKGYPTAAHMNAIRKYGASPIHRRTFAPLKHMNFDDDGNIIASGQ